MTDADARAASECPPGESLTTWLRNGPKKKRQRSKTEIDLQAAARAELRALLPRAAAQAKQNKLGLLRLITRATRGDATLHADTVRELAKLLPEAVIKARGGNPAMLRLILRATR